MRVFVTGASGWIGSAVVPELINAGHSVLGLARSDASAAKLEQAGADVHRGSLEDLDALRAGATAADAVVHLAYIHDFTRMADAAAADRAAIDALGAALAHTGKPLAIASGVAGFAPGTVVTERDLPAPGAYERGDNQRRALALADRGVRVSVVRLPPTVHGAGDPGFVATLVRIARETGVSGYIGDGANRWCAVHRLDAARVFRLAIETAPAGAVLHAIAEEAVPTRAIAEAIGRGLDLPVEPRPPAHFDWLGFFFGMDAPASSAGTRELLGWAPQQPGLLADLEHYFTAATPA